MLPMDVLVLYEYADSDVKSLREDKTGVRIRYEYEYLEFSDLPNVTISSDYLEFYV